MTLGLAEAGKSARVSSGIGRDNSYCSQGARNGLMWVKKKKKRENHQKPATLWDGKVTTKSPAFHMDQLGIDRSGFSSYRAATISLLLHQIPLPFCYVPLVRAFRSREANPFCSQVTVADPLEDVWLRKGLALRSASSSRYFGCQRRKPRCERVRSCSLRLLGFPSASPEAAAGRGGGDQGKGQEARGNVSEIRRVHLFLCNYVSGQP